jgi:hypothetical protein
LTRVEMAHIAIKLAGKGARSSRGSRDGQAGLGMSVRPPNSPSSHSIATRPIREPGTHLLLRGFLFRLGFLLRRLTLRSRGRNGYGDGSYTWGSTRRAQTKHHCSNLTRGLTVTPPPLDSGLQGVPCHGINRLFAPDAGVALCLPVPAHLCG